LPDHEIGRVIDEVEKPTADGSTSMLVALEHNKSDTDLAIVGRDCVNAFGH
jgi:hypothetical protein